MKLRYLGVKNATPFMLPAPGLPNRFPRILLENTMAIVTAKSDVSGIDVYMQAMGDSSEQQQMWLVNANHIYSKVFGSLENHVSDGLSMIRKAFAHVSLLAEERQKHFRSFPGNGGDSYCRWLRLTSIQLQAADETFDFDMRAFNNGDIKSSTYSAERKMKLKVKGNPWISGFETQLPTHAGSCLYTLKTSMLLRGCQNSNEDMVLHSMAYLYKAARHCSLMASAWPEMDFFIASQASVGPLVPHFKVKTKLTQIFEAFQKAVGARFKSGTAKQPKRSLEFDLERGTIIKVGAPFTASLLENLGSLKEVKGDSRALPGKIVEVTLHRLAASEADPKRKAKSPMLRATYSPLELLGTFKSSFQREEPLLNFDHASFWIECARVVRMIQEVMPMTNGKNAERPAHMAYEILCEMANLQGKPEELKDSMLAKAAAVMQSYVGESGGILLREAREQSSGTIPKHLRPANAAKA